MRKMSQNSWKAITEKYLIVDDPTEELFTYCGVDVLLSIF